MVNDNAHYIFDNINDLKRRQPKYYTIKVKNPQSFHILLAQNNRNKINGDTLLQIYPYSNLLAMVGKITYD